MTVNATSSNFSDLFGGSPEALVETALIAGGVGLWEWVCESDRLAISPYLETLLGYPTGTFPATRAAFLQRLHPLDRSRFERALSAARDSAAALDLELRIPELTGGVRWFSAKARVMTNAAGAAQRVVGTMQEIPGSVVAERRMRAQQTALLALATGERLTERPMAEALDRITELAGITLDVERASVWLFDEGRTKLRCVSLYRRSVGCHMAGAELDVAAFPRYVLALDEERAIDAADAQHDPRTAELKEGYLVPLGITSMLEATLRIDGTLAGVVCSEHVGPIRPWLLDEKSFAASLADVAATVLLAERERSLARALATSEERYRTFFALSTEAILRAEMDPPVDVGADEETQADQVAARAVVAEGNRALARLLRVESPQRLVGRRIADLLPAGAARRLALEWVQSGYRFSEYEVALDGPEGKVWLLGSMVGIERDGRLHGLWSTWRDISRRKEALFALEHQARHDVLTGLPNRKWVGERLQELLAAPESARDGLALLLLDLDHFKEINDALGHFAGDQLLKLVGPRLAELLRPHQGEVARLGGDEFALVLRGCRDESRVLALARDLTDALRKPFQVGMLRLAIDASIGAALYPVHGTDPSTLLRCADVAMYEAKRKGLRTAVYSSSLDRYSPRRLSLANELDEAIRNGQLTVHFQPIVDLQTRRISGVEALARWNHPEYGEIAPEEFIPIAEMGDQIRHLTQRVLGETCRQWQAWRADGLETRVAVNLSTRVLVDRSFVAETRRILHEAAFPAEWLHFEITESAMLADPQRAVANMNELHKLGVGFSVDDFGTGFSSLTYLQQLPLVTLKIDRSFVTHMMRSARDASIVRSTVQLAHALGLKCVAEGVESKEVLEAIAHMGCDLAQGYAIAVPQPGGQLVAWARANGWHA